MEKNTLDYAYRLANQKKYKEALSLFTKLANQEKNDEEIEFMLLYLAVSSKRYNLAYNYAKNLINKEKYQKIGKISLILLSRILELDEIPKYTREELFMRRDDDIKDDNAINHLIKLILNNNLSYAYQSLKMLHNQRDLDYSSLIIIRLLNKIHQKKNNKILDLIEYEQYDMIINRLKKEPRLPKTDELIVYLTNIIIQLKNGAHFTKNDNYVSNNIYDYIFCNDFEKAYHATNDVIIKKLLKNIIELNNSNIISIYSNEINNLFDSLIYECYNLFINSEFSEIKVKVSTYLKLIDKEMFIPFFETIISYIEKVKNIESSENTSIYAYLTDNLLSLVNYRKVDYELLEKIASENNDVVNENAFYDASTLKYDDYSYGIPNINNIISSFKKHKRIYEIFEEYDVSDDDYPYVLVILAKVSYEMNNNFIGDSIINILKKHIKVHKIDDPELINFMNTVESNSFFYSSITKNNYQRKIYILTK